MKQGPTPDPLNQNSRTQALASVFLFLLFFFIVASLFSKHPLWHYYAVRSGTLLKSLYSGGSQFWFLIPIIFINHIKSHIKSKQLKMGSRNQYFGCGGCSGGACHAACGILVLGSGIKSSPPAMEAWSFNHWWPGKSPDISIFKYLRWF